MDGLDPGNAQPETPWQFKPGETVSPAPESPPAPSNTVSQSAPKPITTANTVPAEVQPNEEVVPSLSPSESITWTASEFINHEKTPLWYVMVGLGGAVLAVLVFLVVHDIFATVVTFVAALVFAAYGARKPRQLQYQLTRDGLYIGEKYFPYDSFRSFGVIDEGQFASIELLPLKRFGQITAIYFARDDEEAIIGVLSDRLPFEDRRRGAVDSLVKRMRF